MTEKVYAVTPEVIHTGSDPAAGSEQDETIGTAGTDQLFRITAINIPLVTDGTAANRIPIVQITDASDNVVLRFAVATAITASTTGGVLAALVENYATDADNYEIIPLPKDLIIPAGWKVKTSTTNIQAGDDYGVMLVFGNKMRPL